jgi:hypothetical protein
MFSSAEEIEMPQRKGELQEKKPAKGTGRRDG